MKNKVSLNKIPSGCVPDRRPPRAHRRAVRRQARALEAAGLSSATYYPVFSTGFGALEPRHSSSIQHKFNRSFLNKNNYFH